MDRSMKPHRQIRHSRRVSSETGVAIDAMIGDSAPTQYLIARSEIMTILRRLPLEHRRTMVADVAREIMRS